MLEESIHLMGAAEICIFSPQGKFFVSNLFRSFIYIDSLVFLEETSYIVGAQNIQPFSLYRTSAIISRGLYIFYPIFLAVYIQKRLIFQTVYALKSGNSSKIPAVYNQERFQIKSGL